MSTPNKKQKIQNGGPAHPIDASGVLYAAKMGQWDAFRTNLDNHATMLTFQDFNELPPGRTFGVIHQIAYHGEQGALECLLERHPRVNLMLETNDGRTALEVARDEDAPSPFLACLQHRMTIQTHHELVNQARDGLWDEFFEQLDTAKEEHDSDFRPPAITVDTLNTVPPGRIWGILHQVCYWGNVSALEKLLREDYFPTLDLELETNEEAPQTPLDIAIGRGHTEFITCLRTKIDESEANQKPAAAAPSLVTAPSCSMKAPVPAADKLCNICYMTDHEPETMAVGCDNGHFMCQPCFSSWVESESNIDANPQNILLNGGRITCVCKKSDDCPSLAFANKLIAMVVPDEIYEQYLRARDYVVGKEAVAGALAKISMGGMDAVEQEQIRSMYSKHDGSYPAYMCGKCSFGPIDHGWCSNLSAHHGEQKKKSGNKGMAQINNACPKCNWFAEDINDWPMWNGKFQSSSS